MKFSRKNFLLMAGATSLTALGAEALSANDHKASLPDLETELEKVLGLSGEYGKNYGKSKIKAFHLHNQPKSSPLHQNLEALWLDVFEKTNGELFVSPLPQDASLQGGDPQAVRLVSTGRFEVVSVAAPIIDKLSPDVVGIQNLSFIYQSSQEVFEIINQPIFAKILDHSVAKYNLKYLSNGTFDNGMRVITSVEAKPIYNLDSFKDLIIRIPPSYDFQQAMQALEANPKFFTMNEVYDVLKNRIVEAQENPLSVAKGFALHEVTKYLNMTNHAWSGYNTFFNSNFWNKLSPSNRKVISELLPIYQAKQIKAQGDYNSAVYKELTTKYGMTATQPDCSKAVQKLIPIYKSIYSQLNSQAKSLIKSKLEQKTGVKFS